MAKRALNIRDIQEYKPTVLDFTGEWLEAVGRPELTGSWILWGNSSNGKTSLALQIAKYMAQFGRVDYNSLEEGLSLSMQQAINQVGMSDIGTGFYLLDKEPIKEMVKRLRKRRSANVIIIDSLQYAGITYQEYKQLMNEFRNKLFIFVSHADGAHPKGNVAKSIRYDANVKMFVENFYTIPQSRYGGGEPFIIWQKGYEDFVEFK